MNILIVLAGSPPSKDLLTREIECADLVVAVDGGFNILKKYGLSPDLLIGDLDSVEKDKIGSIDVQKLWDQDHTDLQKTLKYLNNHYAIHALVLLGAGGQRTDHLLHNLHICGEIHPAVNVVFRNEIIDQSTLETICRVTPDHEVDLRVKQGATLSILPVGDFKGLNSHGLKWEIVNQDRSGDFMSQSNQVIKDDPAFKVISGYAYIAVYQ